MNNAYSAMSEDLPESDSEILETEVEFFELPFQEQRGPTLGFAEAAAPAATEPPQTANAANGTPSSPRQTAAPKNRSFSTRPRAAADNPGVRAAASGGATRPKAKMIAMLKLPALETLQRSWKIFRFGAVIFTATAFLGILCGNLITYFMPESDGMFVPAVQLALQESIAAFFKGVSVYAVFHILRYNTVEFGEAFAKGMSHVLPIAATSILVLLCTVSGVVPAGIAVAAGMDFFLAIFLFALIPAIFFRCALALAVPACTVERLGPIAGIRRSIRLTKGFRWPIFWIFTVLWLLVFGIAITLHLFLLGGVGSFFLRLVLTAMENIIIAVIYHDLRELKDDTSLDAMLRVFD